MGIVQDKKVGKYYGFVAFKNSDEARNAVTNLNNHEFETGDKLYVDYAQQKTQRKKLLQQRHMKYKNETNLYIRSIRPDVTEE